MYKELPAHYCKILMTDTNGRLGRTKPRSWLQQTFDPEDRAVEPDPADRVRPRVGRWTLYDSDNEMGAMFRRFVEEQDLDVVSTHFTPRKKGRGGAGTFQGIRKVDGRVESFRKLQQLDYIALSSRFRSSCVNVQTRWGPSEARWKNGTGQRQDHAMLVMTFRMRLRKPAQVTRPDIAVLKTEDGAAAATEEWNKRWLESAASFVLPTSQGPVDMEHRRQPGPLSLEEIGVGVEGSAEGMQLETVWRSPEESQRAAANAKWTRLKTVAGQVIESLPTKKWVQQPQYFSTMARAP